MTETKEDVAVDDDGVWVLESMWRTALHVREHCRPAGQLVSEELNVPLNSCSLLEPEGVFLIRVLFG